MRGIWVVIDGDGNTSYSAKTEAGERFRSRQAAVKIEENLRKVPEADRVMSIDFFVPKDQPAKLAAIRKAAEVLGPTFKESKLEKPTDAENVDALKDAATSLNQAAAGKTGPGADAIKRLAGSVEKLAQSSEAQREEALVRRQHVLRPQGRGLEAVGEEAQCRIVGDDAGDVVLGIVAGRALAARAADVVAQVRGRRGDRCEIVDGAQRRPQPGQVVAAGKAALQQLDRLDRAHL